MRDETVTRALAEEFVDQGEVWQRLVPLVYDELHRLAAAFMRRERPDHTLQATALLNEAFVRLLDATRLHVGDRQHFVRLAARMMRRVLVDHARARAADKRLAGIRTTWSDDLAAEAATVDILELDQVLGRLAAIDDVQARVVELRCFGGLTVSETAEVMGLSPSTVDRHWRFARAWLRRQLESLR